MDGRRAWICSMFEVLKALKNLSRLSHSDFGTYAYTLKKTFPHSVITVEYERPVQEPIAEIQSCIICSFRSACCSLKVSLWSFRLYLFVRIVVIMGLAMVPTMEIANAIQAAVALQSTLVGIGCGNILIRPFFCI